MQMLMHVCANRNPLRKVKFDSFDEDGKVFMRLGKTIRNSLNFDAIAL